MSSACTLFVTVDQSTKQSPMTTTCDTSEKVKGFCLETNVATSSWPVLYGGVSSQGWMANEDKK